MLEIRIHGRGGQGNVVAAEMLALAAHAAGRQVQAFPAFGAERTGAPVQAFVRIADRPIRLRSQVYAPSVVIVQDPTLIGMVPLCEGLTPGGLLLVNDRQIPPALLEIAPDGARIVAIPATDIALDVLGRPTPNTTLLGAFAAATGEIALEAVQRAVRERFPGEIGERNATAAARGHAASEPAAIYTVPHQAAMPSAGPVPVAAPSSNGVPLTLGLVAQPGSSRAYHTGTWRTWRPVFLQSKCTGCRLCVTYCPEGTVFQAGAKQFDVDLTYCKGCALCAEECPVEDIIMEQETAP